MLRKQFILHTFAPPKIDQISQQKNFSWFLESTFSCERCRKNHFWHSHTTWESFFFSIPTQRGSTIFTPCDTSPARMRFFSFFQHLPCEKLKNDKKAAFEPLIRRHVVNDAVERSSPNLHLPWAIAFWNAISILYKFNRRATKSFIFQMNLHNFISEVLPHHPKKLCMLQNNDRFSQGIPSFFHLSVFFPFCAFALPIRSWQFCGIFTLDENHSYFQRICAISYQKCFRIIQKKYACCKRCIDFRKEFQAFFI